MAIHTFDEVEGWDKSERGDGLAVTLSIEHIQGDRRMTEKEQFAKKLEEFVTKQKSHISSDDGQWTIKGFIGIFKNVYTISSDTKILSKILEIHLFPKILAFASTNGYKAEMGAMRPNRPPSQPPQLRGKEPAHDPAALFFNSAFQRTGE